MSDNTETYTIAGTPNALPKVPRLFVFCAQESLTAVSRRGQLHVMTGRDKLAVSQDVNRLYFFQPKQRSIL